MYKLRNKTFYSEFVGIPKVYVYSLSFLLHICTADILLYKTNEIYQKSYLYHAYVTYLFINNQLF